MLETHSQAGGERRLVVGDLSEVAAKTQLVRAPQNVQTCWSECAPPVFTSPR